MLDSSRSEAVVVALAATSGVIKSAAQVPFSPSGPGWSNHPPTVGSRD